MDWRSDVCSSDLNDPTLNEENARLVAEDSASGNSPALSVSELSNALKRTVEDRFGHVRVRGEISGWKRAASGHGYLCLKDDNAVLDGVMWKGVDRKSTRLNSSQSCASRMPSS